MAEGEPNYTARERVATLEGAFKGHLETFRQHSEENIRNHTELVTLIRRVSDRLSDDIRKVVARIWWLAGTAVLAAGSIVMALYQSMEK